MRLCPSFPGKEVFLLPHGEVPTRSRFAGGAYK